MRGLFGLGLALCLLLAFGGTAAAQTAGSCPVGQYRAEYFANRTLSGSPASAGCEGSIDNDWGGAPAGKGVAADNFSVRRRGRHLHLQRAGRRRGGRRCGREALVDGCERSAVAKGACQRVFGTLPPGSTLSSGAEC